MRGRFILNSTGTIDAAATFPVFFQTVPTNNYLIAFSEYHNFTAKFMNEFRFSFNRDFTQLLSETKRSRASINFLTSSSTN